MHFSTPGFAMLHQKWLKFYYDFFFFLKCCWQSLDNMMTFFFMHRHTKTKRERNREGKDEKRNVTMIHTYNDDFIVPGFSSVFRHFAVFITGNVSCFFFFFLLFISFLFAIYIVTCLTLYNGAFGSQMANLPFTFISHGWQYTCNTINGTFSLATDVISVCACSLVRLLFLTERFNDGKWASERREKKNLQHAEALAWKTYNHFLIYVVHEIQAGKKKHHQQQQQKKKNYVYHNGYLLQQFI